MFRKTIAIAVLAVTGLAGCGQDGPEPGQKSKALPSVIVLGVQEKDVASVTEYVGRTRAAQRVDIRARVSGTLLDRPFKEGTPVKKGDLLFSIDPAEFEANLASAQADVARAKATVEEASNNLVRYTELVKKDVASVAKFDEAKAKDGSARAELAAAEAAVQKAQLDLDYTKIASPIDGRIGSATADVGNLIGSDSGTLATVIRMDPIRVVFSVGEKEYLLFTERKKDGDQSRPIPKIRLANDKIYPHQGDFDLIDNEVDPATGTIKVRVVFPNPERLLVPGQFVNVVLTSDTPERRVVVPQSSVQENQTGPFVLVVGAEDRVEARPIKTGQRVGAEIVVAEGLEAGETIITEGIQKVRPGGRVKSVQAEDKTSNTSIAK